MKIAELKPTPRARSSGRRDVSPAARQLDRLPVRSRLRGRVPFVHAALEVLLGYELFAGDELFQGGEPVLVVMAAVVRRAARGRSGELGGERAGPFAPGERTARVQGNRHRKGLRLPPGLEHRPRVVARQGR